MLRGNKTMEARNRSLPDWITRIRTRQLALPRFQRMEAWGHKQVSDLLRTVLRGLPAGAVLTLEVGDQIPFISRPMVGAPDQGERIAELLLDGQQRLTALWRSLTDHYSDRTYFVQIPEGEFVFDELEILPQTRWERDGQRYPVWADSPQACWERRCIPVRLLNPYESLEAAITTWAENAGNHDPQTVIAIERLIQRLRQRFVQFNLPFLALPVGTRRDVALDVFVKMNTSMAKLTAFDIIVAQTEETTGQSLHDLVKGTIHSCPELIAYDETPEDTLLSAASLLQDRVPNQTGYFGLDLNRMVTDWPIIKRGVEAAIDFLEEERVLDADRFPTEPALAPIIALWANVPDQPDQLGNSRVLLRRYLWRAFFTERYERAAATAALQDYRALRKAITCSGDAANVPCFDEAQYPLPTAEEIMQAKWPKRRDRLARAVLLVSLRGGAQDIADGATATRDHLKRREHHHLFPVAHLRDQGIEDAEAYRALNCAVITWRTNRTIAAGEPLAYLKARAEAAALGEDEIRRRLATHNISFEALSHMQYRKFLAARAQTTLEAIQNLCNGEQWTPTV
jgi:hypothetical protein